MNKTTYQIENNKLVAYYVTFTGKKGRKEFIYAGKGTIGYTFREEGTNNHLYECYFCNLSKCFTPLKNSTQLSTFIEVDLTHFDSVEPKKWNAVNRTFAQ